MTNGGKQILWRGTIVLGILSLATLLVISGHTSADVLKSPDYQLQPTVGNSFGGSVGSSNYKLVDSGGEAAIGNGAGGSYKLGAGFIAELKHSISLRVEPAGLIGYWPMNEGADSTIHDASINSNDGTVNGGLSWVNGKTDKALSFDGTSGYVSFSDIPQLDNIAEVTWSAWVRPTDGTKDQVFLSKQGSNYFGINNSKPYVSFDVDGQSKTLTGSTTLSNNTWYQLSATYDGSIIKLYVNGALDAIKSTNGALDFDTGVLNIGRWTSASPKYFDGAIDGVHIYDNALSAEEVKANYGAESAGFDSGLIVPSVQSGDSETINADIIVKADAPYSLLTRETNPLTQVHGTDTIASISGTIANPISWIEGSTKGLGFSVLSGPSGVPAKWSGGTKYAAVPDDSIGFYSRSGLSGGATDDIKIQYRLDVPPEQPSGRYKNNIIYTATITP